MSRTGVAPSCVPLTNESRPQGRQGDAQPRGTAILAATAEPRHRQDKPRAKLVRRPLAMLAVLSGVVVLAGTGAGDGPADDLHLVSADTHKKPATAVQVAPRPVLRARHQHPVKHRGTRHAVGRARTHHRSLSAKAAARAVDLAPSDARETVHAALSSDVNEPGHCLEWARERADIPPLYDDAATAWANATGRRPGDRHPPVGAAVYWTGGSSGYGHIAISVGDGKVRSSDAGGEGRVETVPVDWAEKKWGLTYAGWSNSINGYTIPGVGASRT